MTLVMGMDKVVILANLNDAPLTYRVLALSFRFISIHTRYPARYIYKYPLFQRASTFRTAEGMFRQNGRRGVDALTRSTIFTHVTSVRGLRRDLNFLQLPLIHCWILSTHENQVASRVVPFSVSALFK